MKLSRLVGIILTIPFLLVLSIAIGINIVVMFIAFIVIMVALVMFFFGLCMILGD